MRPSWYWSHVLWSWYVLCAPCCASSRIWHLAFSLSQKPSAPKFVDSRLHDLVAYAQIRLFLCWVVWSSVVSCACATRLWIHEFLCGHRTGGPCNCACGSDGFCWWLRLLRNCLLSFVLYFWSLLLLALCGCSFSWVRWFCWTCACAFFWFLHEFVVVCFAFFCLGLPFCAVSL